MKRILVPVDFSSFSLRALRYGCAFARQNGAELYLLHVVQDLTPIGVGGGGIAPAAAADYFEQLESSAGEALDQVAQKSWFEGLKVWRKTVIGSPWNQIIEFAASHNIDLICLGTHGRGGFARFMLGSVAEKVVQHARCQTLVVRRHEREFVDEEHLEPALKKILVPCDFSDTSRSALEEGRALAASWAAELHLLHVVEDNSPSVSQIALAYPMFRAYVNDLVQTGQQQLEELVVPSGKRVQIKAVVGDPTTKINDYADEHGIDLIVVGTHGRTGPSHWLLGSVAERIVRSAPCPVLVTPPHPSPESPDKFQMLDEARLRQPVRNAPASAAIDL
jgi:nucleotide-binding universal stress UspA family protein